jgi:hypothetical protein
MRSMSARLSRHSSVDPACILHDFVTSTETSGIGSLRFMLLSVPNENDRRAQSHGWINVI